MELFLREVREIIGGVLHGDGDTRITGVGGLRHAREGDLAFVKDFKYYPEAHLTSASALVTPEKIDLPKPQIVTENPYEAFIRFLQRVAEEKKLVIEGVHRTAVVEEGVKLGPGVGLGAHVVISAGAAIGAGTIIYPNTTIGLGSRIGDECVIYSNVSIREQVRIGDRVIIHGCTVIGADGFGFLWDGEEENIKIPQVGTVRIDDDVEIGACCTIDRAALDATWIQRGVKMDNHCHIGHNAVIGERCILVAYAKVGGSTILGRRVVLGEDVGVTNNITIGDRARIGGGSRVYRSVPAGARFWGSPAKHLAEEKRVQASLRKLPWLRKKLVELLKKSDQ
ncbi:MAG: UDP-3-O-(3-hydroxymyristoyl)glucosamine N-acyltransferase [Planctomycetota bacterium]|nr:UDP-3-O-(3-hydroxymyristoyl)glucosamine N-acyltransferase [Planctomycetota bacterium]